MTELESRSFSRPEKSQSEIGRDLAAVMVDLDESQSE